MTYRKILKEGKKIAMLTAYDYTTAQIVDAAGMDIILVGDSASNVMAGNMTTLPITLDQMIYHAKAVVRATKRALVVCDMPFGTYQVHPTESVTNAIRIMKESHCDALKLEGGVEIIDTVRKILDAGIPICGHLGLTPQSINKFGTYTVRARDDEEANKLISDAHALEEAGCFAIVLEKIPAKLAERVANELTIPIIGIGAGHAVDGQVLVVADMRGLQHFLRSEEGLGACVFSISRLEFVIYYQLYIEHFSHHTLTVYRHDVEARTDLIDERNAVLEVFRMLVVGAHEVRSIIIVCHTILCFVRLVERNADVGIIAVLLANIAHAVRLRHVCHAIDFGLLQSVFAYIAFGLGIEVRIVEPVILYRLVEFQNHQLHGCQ